MRRAFLAIYWKDFKTLMRAYQNVLQNWDVSLHETYFPSNWLKGFQYFNACIPARVSKLRRVLVRDVFSLQLIVRASKLQCVHAITGFNTETWACMRRIVLAICWKGFKTLMRVARTCFESDTWACVRRICCCLFMRWSRASSMMCYLFTRWSCAILMNCYFFTRWSRAIPMSC